MRYVLAIVVILGAPHVARAQGAAPAESRPAQNSAAQPRELEEAEAVNRQFIDLYKQGKYEEALPLARRVLKLKESALPADDRRLIPALNNVAFTLIAREKYGDAIPLLDRSLALMQSLVGRDSPQLAAVEVQLALALYKNGDKARAGELLTRVAEIREKAYGVNHPNTVESLHLLADYYQGQRDYKKAEELLLRIINAKEQAGGEGRKGLNDTRVRYMTLLLLDGREKEAEAVLAKIKEGVADAAPTPLAGGILSGRAVLKVAPAYPMAAKSSHVSGAVSVQIVVDELGRVIEAKAVDGPPLLRRESENAVKLWRFSPTLLEGMPVQVTGVVVVNFTLQ
jgi:TonB family protein